jgi:hypothetical protein
MVMRNERIFVAAVFEGKRTCDIAKEWKISPTRARSIVMSVAKKRDAQKFDEISNANLNVWGNPHMTVELLRGHKEHFKSISKANVCRGCRFWDTTYFSEVYDELITEIRDKADFGECHRHAPSPIIEFREDLGDKPVTWPHTDGDDFCGEWERYA